MTEAEVLGVPALDRLLPPAPTGTAMLLTNEPGIEAEAFLYQAAASHLEAGHSVVYLINNRSPSSVREAMESFGFELSEHEDRLHFIDAYSPLMGQMEATSYTAKDPTNAEEICDLLDRAAYDHPGSVLFLDSLSSWIDQSSPEAFIQVRDRLDEAMHRYRYAAGLFTLWPYTEELTSVFDAFDGVVRLQGVEERVTFSQFLHVERANWTDEADGASHLYKTLRPGGVFLYIPKIVITGPYNAGKSTLVHAASDTAVSVDRLGTTVALDHGHIAMDELTADIFGTPGQTRFDPILQTLSDNALGVLVVVDASKPESFGRARELMEQTWKQGLPAIVVANKQDLPTALSPDEVAKRIGGAIPITVVGCEGKDRESARKVLRMMIDRILQGGEAA